MCVPRSIWNEATLEFPLCGLSKTHSRHISNHWKNSGDDTHRTILIKPQPLKPCMSDILNVYQIDSVMVFPSDEKRIMLRNPGLVLIQYGVLPYSFESQSRHPGSRSAYICPCTLRSWLIRKTASKPTSISKAAKPLTQAHIRTFFKHISEHLPKHIPEHLLKHISKHSNRLTSSCWLFPSANGNMYPCIRARSPCVAEIEVRPGHRHARDKSRVDYKHLSLGGPFRDAGMPHTPGSIFHVDYLEKPHHSQGHGIDPQCLQNDPSEVRYPDPRGTPSFADRSLDQQEVQESIYAPSSSRSSRAPSNSRSPRDSPRPETYSAKDQRPLPGRSTAYLPNGYAATRAEWREGEGPRERYTRVKRQKIQRRRLEEPGFREYEAAQNKKQSKTYRDKRRGEVRPTSD